MVDDSRNLNKDSYNEFANYLNKKYGKPEKDYFNKQSFANHLLFSEDYLEKYKIMGKKGNISPSRSKTNLKSKGLYLHHIKENRFSNLGCAKKIYDQNKENNIAFSSFSNQEKSNLVKCNLLEHAFLHALILIFYKKNTSEDSNGYSSLKGQVMKSPEFKNYYQEFKSDIDFIFNDLNNLINK